MKKSNLTILTVIALATGAQAAVILSDSFSYPDGAIVGAPASPWVAHSGSGPMLISSSQLRVVSTSGEDVNALLAGQPYTTNSAAVLYSSFTVKFTVLPSVAGTYFAHFKDTNTGAATGFGARVWTSTTNAVSGGSVPAGKFRLSIGNGTLVNAASGQIDTDLDTNVVYTVVTRFACSNGLATIWLDPMDESDPGVDATDIGTVTRPNPIDVVSYAFRQPGSTASGVALVDDLAVGTLFNDVAGTNRPPTISAILSQNTPANTPTAPLPFTVQDQETPAASLVLSSNSSNTLLVPNANISIGGSDTNRTVTVTPAAGQQGATTITISASDGVNTTSVQFVLTVGAPSISAIPNQSTPTNTPTAAIPFTVSDAESAASNLTVSASSSNPTLVTNIVFGGSGSNRTVTLTPELDQAGISTITITVSDGTNTASTSFALIVPPSLGVLFSDAFSYPDIDLYSAPGTPWFHASPTGTNFGQVQVVSGMAELSESLAEDLAAPLTNGPYSSSSGLVVYSGFTVNFSALPSQAGDYFAHFKDSTSGTTFRAKIFASTTNAASGKFRLGIANQGNSVSGQIARDLCLNTTYGVVTRFNAGTGESRIWLNPAVESDPSVAPTDLPLASSVGAYGLRETGGIGTNRIDNLVISTSFADVVPSVPTPVQPNITSIQFVSGNVQIDFTAGAGDTACLFTLQSAGTVNGPFIDDVSATITQLGPGSFRAVIAPSGGTRFYRIKR